MITEMDIEDARLDLFPYQDTGAEFLAGRNYALLADEMGLGKSPQAVRACDMRNARRILVLCPAIARTNWEREFRRFSIYGLPTHVMFSRDDEPAAEGITICSYDIAAFTKAKLERIQWGLIICDEAHYLMSPEASRTQIVYGKTGLIHKTKAYWALTGTPMPTHPGNLWPHLYVMGATSLKYDDFVKKFCKMRRTPYGEKIVGAKNIPELKAILAKVMLRRKKVDVLKDLPPIRYEVFTVEPAPVDIEIYMFEAWLRHGGTEKLAAKIVQQEEHMAATLKALRASKTPMRDTLHMLTGMQASIPELRQHTGLAKAPAVVQMVKAELESGAIDKIVLFAVHSKVIDALREGLKDFGATVIYGGTPAPKRQKHIDNFQTNPKHRVFIAQILACGTAVTLTAACEAMFVEEDWTPANNAQAAMRLHRIGQTRPVRVRFAALANSTDERVTEALRRKMRDELEIFG